MNLYRSNAFSFKKAGIMSTLIIPLISKKLITSTWIMSDFEKCPFRRAIVLPEGQSVNYN